MILNDNRGKKHHNKRNMQSSGSSLAWGSKKIQEQFNVDFREKHEGVLVKEVRFIIISIKNGLWYKRRKGSRYKIRGTAGNENMNPVGPKLASLPGQLSNYFDLSHHEWDSTCPPNCSHGVSSLGCLDSNTIALWTGQPPRLLPSDTALNKSAVFQRVLRTLHQDKDSKYDIFWDGTIPS